MEKGWTAPGKDWPVHTETSSKCGGCGTEMEGGRRGLMIVASAFLIQLFAFGASTSIGVYNVEFLSYFDNDTVGVSLIAAINWAVLLCSGPLTSFLMTKMSYRQITLLGSVMTVAGVLFMPVLPYIPAMWVSFGLVAGLGISLVYLPSHVLCGLYYERHQSLATGIATSGSGLGGAIMPIVIGTLIEDYGWKGSLIIVGGIELHLIVCAALLRPPPTGKAAEKTKDRETHALLNGTCSRNEDGSANEADGKSTEPLGRYKEERTSPEDTGRETTATDEKASAINNTGVAFQAFTESILCKGDTLNEGEGISADKQELASKPADCPGDTYIAQPQVSTDTSSGQHTMADSESCPAETEAKVLRQIYLFTDAGFDIYFLSCVFWNIGATTVLSFGPEFTTEAGISALDSAWLLTLFGLGSFVGSLIGGMTGNTWTKTRESQYVAANFLLGICTGVVPLGSTFGEFAAILLTDGIAFGVILGLLVVVLTDIVGTNNLGDGLGYIMLANGIGAFVGPSLTGQVREMTGRYDLAFYMAGLFDVTGGVIMWLTPILRRFFPACLKARPQRIVIEIQP